MKQFLLTFFGLCFSLMIWAQKAPAKFSEEKFSFGKIVLNKPVTHIFKFTNKGSKPLIIQDAVAQCGCTTPKFSKAAIAKGKTENIEVTFNAASPGVFTKTVTVTFAGYKEPTILTIDGEVNPSK